MRQEGQKLHQIAHVFNDVYELFIYPGDLFKWLDTLVHNLRAVKRIAKILKINEMVAIIEMLINSIERPGSKK
jgi:superfamily II helicase